MGTGLEGEGQYMEQWLVVDVMYITRLFLILIYT